MKTGNFFFTAEAQRTRRGSLVSLSPICYLLSAFRSRRLPAAGYRNSLNPYRNSLNPISYLLTPARLGLLALTVLAATGWGQQSITTANSPVTIDFNSIGTSATATLPTGFKLGTDWSSGTTATTQAAGTSGTGILSSSSTGGFYNFA